MNILAKVLRFLILLVATVVYPFLILSAGFVGFLVYPIVTGFMGGYFMVPSIVFNKYSEKVRELAEEKADKMG